MSNARQVLLDALDVDAATAIGLAELKPLTYATDRTIRTVGVRAQKRILQFVGMFPKDECWLSIEDIAQRLVMDEKTVRAAIRVLVDQAELILEWGHRNRRRRAVHWTELGQRIPRSQYKPASDNPTGATAKRSGHSIEKCPDASGHLIPKCPDDPGISARTLEEKEFIKENSSSSITRKPEPMTDDDGGLSFDFGLSDPTWTDVDGALQAVGLNRRPQAIETAQRRRLSPAAVIDAAFVIATNPTEPLKRPLDAGALMTWLRDGCWPQDNVPTAAELRERIAAAERREAEERERREQEAGRIRERTRADASRQHPMPSEQFTLAVMFGRLAKAGLEDLVTPEERAAHERRQDRFPGDPPHVQRDNAACVLPDRSRGDPQAKPERAETPRRRGPKPIGSHLRGALAID